MENEIKEIHLFLLEKCDHACELCCNKQYEIDKIPVITVDELKQAETILFTGGEPFLIGKELTGLARRIKAQYSNIKNIYAYTSGASLLEYLMDNLLHLESVLSYLDGVSIAPKNKNDMKCLETLFFNYQRVLSNLRSNRIYMFPQFKNKIEDLYNSTPELNHIDLIDRKWQETFEPGAGVFRRLPILF